MEQTSERSLSHTVISVVMIFFVLMVSLNPFPIKTANTLMYSISTTLEKLLYGDDADNNLISENETQSLQLVEEVKEIIHHYHFIDFTQLFGKNTKTKNLWLQYDEAILQPHLEVLLQPPLKA